VQVILACLLFSVLNLIPKHFLYLYLHTKINISCFPLSDSMVTKTVSIFVCLILGLLCMDEWEVSQ
jgi:hypothetical protein